MAFTTLNRCCSTFGTFLWPEFFFRTQWPAGEKKERLAFLPLQLRGSGVFFFYGGIICFCLFVYPLTHLFHVARPHRGFACFCTGIVAFNSSALIQSICRDVSIKCVLSNVACGRGWCSLLMDSAVTPLVFPFAVVVLFYVLLRLHP